MRHVCGLIWAFLVKSDVGKFEVLIAKSDCCASSGLKSLLVKSEVNDNLVLS